MKIGKYYKLLHNGLEFKVVGKDNSNYICRIVNSTETFLLTEGSVVDEIPIPKFDLVKGMKIRGG